MDPIESSTAAAGNRSGSDTLQGPNAGQPEESPSAATVTPALSGPKSGEVPGHRIDARHVGRAASAREGTAGDGTIAVRGPYAAPPGPDRGRRIEITPGPDGLRIAPTDPDAGGTEDLAVEGLRSRA